MLGGIIIALKEAGDQAERLREFSASLAFRADGSSYNTGALASQAAALERLGASAKDANAAINALVNQSVAADAIGSLGRAAQETAERQASRFRMRLRRRQRLSPAVMTPSPRSTTSCSSSPRRSASTT